MAHGAQGALDRAMQLDYDLVFMDNHMPPGDAPAAGGHMLGSEAVAQIRRAEARRGPAA